MLSNISLNKLINYLHLGELVKSWKECMSDNAGGFLIPVSVKLKDREFERYRHLPIDWSISAITKEDLPSEFSSNAVKTVDMFRRKTVNLDVECMIYFDIQTGNIVSCNFADENIPNEVTGEIYPDFLEGMHIASLHNHPKHYCSPPSSKNFQMLSLDFEEYELILSERELWILESKDIIFDEETINKIREKTGGYLEIIFNDSNIQFENGYEVWDNVKKIYGDLLLIYFNKEFDNIKLIRRNLNG